MSGLFREGAFERVKKDVFRGNKKAPARYASPFNYTTTRKTYVMRKVKGKKKRVVSHRKTYSISPFASRFGI